MKIKDIKTCDLKNGAGIRISIWVTGCEHHCKGCQNPETWDENEGEDFDKYKDFVFEQLSSKDIQGVTLTGGDPLYPGNRADILSFLKECSEKFPEKDVWMWTGYAYEYLIMYTVCREILGHIDVLVDGPYIEEQRDVDLHWRGSGNQRVIAVNHSLKSGKVVLLD